MTGRPKGIWHSACKHCSAPISNEGSGRPRTRCNNCRLRLMRERARTDYRRTKVLKQKQYRETNRDYVRSVKVTIGECYDKLYCHPDLRCTNDNSFMFAFDHRDPDTKSFTISNPEGKKLAGRQRAKALMFADYDAEIAKCDLVCHNCHSMRTFTGKHHKRLIMGEITPIQFVHPTLWDKT